VLTPLSRMAGRRRLKEDLGDSEACEAFGFLFEDLHALHVRSARPVVAKPDQPLDRLRLSLEDRLHGAIGPVADPTPDLCLVCTAPGRVAEEDALDAAVNDDPAADQSSSSSS
jgi:hypothetical protein